MLFCVSSFCSLTRVTKQIAIQLLQVRLTPSHYINFWHFWECPRSTSRRALTSPGHSCDVQGNVTALTTKKPCSWCSFRQPGWEKHVSKIWWDSNNGCNGSQLPCGLWKSVLCIKQVHAIPQSHLLIVNDSIWMLKGIPFQSLYFNICIYILCIPLRFRWWINCIFQTLRLHREVSLMNWLPNPRQGGHFSHLETTIFCAKKMVKVGWWRSARHRPCLSVEFKSMYRLCLRTQHLSMVCTTEMRAPN